MLNRGIRHVLGQKSAFQHNLVENLRASREDNDMTEFFLTTMKGSKNVERIDCSELNEGFQISALKIKSPPF